MATTVEPRDGTQPYVEADEYIDFQLAKTQSQIKVTEILTSASWLGLAVLVYTLAFVVLDQWIMPGGFGAIARAAWLIVLLAGSGAWLISRILRPAFRTVHELYAAKMIESADPTLKSSLLNLVDLQIDGRTSRSALVRTSMEKRAAVELSKVNVDQAIDRQTLLRVAYAVLGMLIVCSLYVMFSPKDAFVSVQRLLLPTSRAAVATRTAIANLTPEDTRILAGELLTVEADILGQMPPLVTLFYTTADHEFVNQPVEMQRLEEGTRFRGVISGEKGRGLMQNITYRLEAGDARTREYEVQVTEPPSSTVEQVRYAFPPYMRLDPKTHTGGHIDGWEGTKLVVNAVTNLPVVSALLVMTDTDNPLAKGEEVRMKIVNGKQLTAEWTLDFRSDGTFARYYHIECKTAAGEIDPRPTVYSIKIQPDQRPDVALLHPTQDLERPANAVVPLLVKASDPDFQLRFVTLRVEKAGEEVLTAALLDEERQSFEGTHDLHLEKLSAAGLKPGDEILYWIEARDNKQPHGNRSATPRLKIKISPPAKADQVAQQLEQDRQKQQEQADQANPERNPLEPERQPAENVPEKEPRQPKPGDKQPDPKPGEQKPRQPGQQPEEPQDRPEDQPKDPQQQPNKPEPNPQDGEQKPGQGADGKPQSGKNGQQQRQPAGGKPGEKPEGDNKPEGQEGSAGEQDGEKSPGGKQTKPGDRGGKTGDPSQQRGEGAQPESNRKQGPADDQTALQKLIDRQQQNAESNPENSEQNSKPGNEPKGDNSAEGDSQASKDGDKDGKEPNQKDSSQEKPGTKNTKPQEGQTPNGAAGKQPSPDKSKAGKGPAQDRPGTEKPDSPAQKKSQPGDNGEQKPRSGDGAKSGDKNAGDDAPKSEPKSEQTQSDKGSQPSSKGEPKSENNDGSAAPQNQPGERDSNGKAMQKPEGGEQPGKSQQPGEQEPNGNKPGDDTSKDNPRGAAGKPQPGKKDGDKKAPQGAQPDSPDDKAGEGATAPGDEKAGGQKGKGPATRPTNEEGPESGEAPEQGPGNGKKPDPKKQDGVGSKPAGEQSSPEMTGEETPAEEGPDAQKRDATGKERGPAIGQDKPEGSAPQAENDLERKPDSKRGAMREPEKNNPNVKPDAGANAANSVKTKSDGAARTEESMKRGDGKNPGQKTPGQPAEKRPGEAPAQKEPNPGQGRPNQKSQRPDSGEKGGGTPQDEGTPGSHKQGQGDTQNQPGKQAAEMDKQGGQPGDKAGQGSKKQAGDKQPGGAKQGAGEKQEGGEKQDGSGESTADKPDGKSDGDPMSDPAGKPEGEGQQGGQGQQGKPDGGQSGKPGQPGAGKSQGEGKAGAGQPGGKPGQGGKSPGSGPSNDDDSANDQTGDAPGNGPGNPNAERRNLPPAERDQAEQEAAEKANEEFARKASNLVLKKLRKDLDRGEVDQELLNELGWKQADMERFVQRLEKQLQDPGDDTSPESVARRQQFEETLKTLGLTSKTKKRKAIGGKPTRVNELGDRKIAPPPEYQELFEEYTKDLSKQAAPKK